VKKVKRVKRVKRVKGEEGEESEKGEEGVQLCCELSNAAVKTRRRWRRRKGEQVGNTVPVLT
jgi:hypothetical protein